MKKGKGSITRAGGKPGHAGFGDINTEFFP